jgi:hypothetical protein
MQRIVLTAFLTTLTVGTALAGPVSITTESPRNGGRQQAVIRVNQGAPSASAQQAPGYAQAPTYAQQRPSYAQDPGYAQAPTYAPAPPPAPAPAPVRQAQGYGGGFLEMLFGGRRTQPSSVYYNGQATQGDLGPGMVDSGNGRVVMDPRYLRQ